MRLASTAGRRARASASPPTRAGRCLPRPLQHRLLGFGDRLGGVAALGAGVGAVHDRVAAVEARRASDAWPRPAGRSQYPPASPGDIDRSSRDLSLSSFSSRHIHPFRSGHLVRRKSLWSSKQRRGDDSHREEDRGRASASFRFFGLNRFCGTGLDRERPRQQDCSLINFCFAGNAGVRCAWSSKRGRNST